jgi:hypothetical protein
MEMGTYRVAGRQMTQTRTAAILNSGRVATTPHTDIDILTWLTPDRIRITDGKNYSTYRRTEEQ